MMCYCRTILSLLVLVLAFFWDAGMWVQWVVGIAALILFLLTVTDICYCRSCTCSSSAKPVAKKTVKKKPAKRKAKRKPAKKKKRRR